MMLIILTALTMVAFAANSVFARLALGDGAMDAASYSALRLAAGAIVLTIVATNFTLSNVNGDPFEKRTRSVLRRGGSLVSAFALLIYVVGFSFAYLALDTGTGALILFACVQATMIGWGVVKGTWPSGKEWAGLGIASAAFIALVSPGLTAPDPWGAAVMALAGLGWGVYSLRGRAVKDPLVDTASNFVWAVIMLMGAAIAYWAYGIAMGAGALSLRMNGFGIVMALVSGALTSGLGYALWYHCLKSLSGTHAAIVQLSVPAIATLVGVVFTGEELTLRLALCSLLILGGVALAITARKPA